MKTVNAILNESNIDQLAKCEEAFDDFNDLIIKQNSWIKKYLNTPFLESPYYKQFLGKSFLIDQGGFDHGDLSGLYTHFQNDHRYKSTRLFGWKGVLENIISHISLSGELKDRLIIDFLAGSGTLAKRLKQLIIGNTPMVLGLDVSLKMCKKALDYEETVLWGNHECHLFYPNIADAVVAAYGFHHVPTKERAAFVSSMQKTLKKNGICLLHDFEEGSASASWYSKVIHRYRPYGHPYEHVTQDNLKLLLAPYFHGVEIKSIYDPFYLEAKKNQDENLLKREFFSYLICFFNLKKLVPAAVDLEKLKDYENQEYWDNIEKIFESSFRLTEREFNLIHATKKNKIREFNEIDVPIVEKLTCRPLNDGRLCLIAPRAAIIGVGFK